MMGEWQPIETAPKNGRKYIAADSNGDIGIVWWNVKKKMFEDMQCLIEDDGVITHWMPLPELPK